MGADVRLVDDGFDIGIRKSWEDAIEDVEAQGGQALRYSRRRLGA